MAQSNSAFISYRRDPGYASAWRIWNGLRVEGIDAFLDLETMRAAGDFDTRIMNQIAGRPYFVLVLTEHTLDRCKKKGDWLRREIEYALDQQRTIVPAIIPPFTIEDALKQLRSKRAADVLKRSNGVSFPPEYFDAAIKQLARLLTPIELDDGQLSPADEAFAASVATKIAQTPNDPGSDDDGSRWTVLAGVLAMALVAALVIWLFVRQPGDETATTSTSSSTSSMSASSSDGPGPPMPIPDGASAVGANQMLTAGQRITSAAGGHVLEMTPGGELVASTNGVAWWRVPDGHDPVPGSVAIMQWYDANLVIYPRPSQTTDHDAVWASGTRNYGNHASLIVKDADGHGLVIIDFGDGNRRIIAREQPARRAGVDDLVLHDAGFDGARHVDFQHLVAAATDRSDSAHESGDSQDPTRTLHA